jgi:hypothetical protein
MDDAYVAVAFSLEWTFQTSASSGVSRREGDIIALAMLFDSGLVLFSCQGRIVAASWECPGGLSSPTSASTSRHGCSLACRSLSRLLAAIGAGAALAWLKADPRRRWFVSRILRR